MMTEAEAQYLQANDAEEKARFEMRVAERMVLSAAKILTLAYPDDHRLSHLRELILEQERLDALVTEASGATGRAFDAHISTAKMGVSNVH